MGHLGFSPAYYSLPQNPIMGMGGLGFETSDYIPAGVTDFLTATTTTQAIASMTGLDVPMVPNWAILASGAVLAWFIFAPSGREYRSARKRLRAKYAGYKRVARAPAGWVD